MSKARTTRHVDVFAKQDHVTLEREPLRIDYALYRQSCWTDVHLDRLKFEKVTGRWREVKTKEFLSEGDDVGEVEVVDLGIQQFLW